MKEPSAQLDAQPPSGCHLFGFSEVHLLEYTRHIRNGRNSFLNIGFLYRVASVNVIKGPAIPT
jgi:hypothetical protein